MAQRSDQVMVSSPEGPQIRVPSVWIPRICLHSIVLTGLLLPSIYESFLSTLWTALSGSSLYRFSGFETLETVLCYIIIEPFYTYKFGRNPNLRIDVRGSKWKGSGSERPKIPKMRRPSKRMGEMFIYIAPLLAMDLTMIKKFAGVPVADIRRSGGYPLPLANASAGDISSSFLLPTIHNFTLESPLQLTRALPTEVPSSRRLLLELIISFFIYDALFFFIHIAFHRIKFLAKIHMPHHTHTEMHPQVTNKLSVAERLSLVLLANFALNIIGSHVLTRSAFVPVFVYLLVEVHSGLDSEWSYDKLIPFGWGAGSRVHAVHHRTGDGAFAPFFTWWDRGLEWMDLRREIKSQ
ncbi:hypothetical protein MMC26_004288 [Xylographa opegraphella]|nr:hypothetical protein [Xylographa opegraphella]